MARLNIQLLGPFAVTLEGQPVTFAYDKVRALLAYLAVEGYGSPIPRARLAGLLWPDQPQSAAQDSLRQALSRLRARLGDRDSGLSAPFVRVERDSLALNPAGGAQVDLAAFQAALARAAAHRHRRVFACPLCMEMLETAAGLLRGGFLEDLCLPDSDLFEEWATDWRERIKIQALDLFGALAQAYEKQGDTPRTLAYATRQIQIDPYHEPAHRQTLLALARSGQRSQAIQHFNHLERLLADELGIPPAADTQSLATAIRQDGPLPDPAAPALRHLPVPLTPLVGREVELSELLVWLSDPERRLISVMGPGGVGKTRLVIQAARQAAAMFSAGVVYAHFLPGAEADQPAAPLADTLARALDLPGAAWEAVMAGLLRLPEVLLVLDGFEHCLSERARVAQLLEAHAGLVVLVTTRARLDLPGEWLFGLGGLDSPPAAMRRQMEAYSAVTLFCQCAQRVKHDFTLDDANRDSVGEICRLVGGLPLALSLAAAWTRSRSCAEIAAEIRQGLDILSTQPAYDEHSSVRAVFETSWKRLDPADRDAFARLSVFRGGFDQAAAQQVAGAGIACLTHLVDQSMLRVTAEGRYDLHDLLAQFGAEKLLQVGHEDETRERHFGYFYQMARQNEAMLATADTLKAFIWLIRETANLREALTWAEAHVPAQASELSRWMHSEFHAGGVHKLDPSHQAGTLHPS